MLYEVITVIAENGKEWIKEQLRELQKEDNFAYFAPLFKGDIPDKWIKKADNLTTEERRAFIIEDNVSFGEWDYDLLVKDFKPEILLDFGVELPDFIINPPVVTSKSGLQLYTTKIKSPIYEPKNEKPSEGSLVDSGKYEQLIRNNFV